MTPHYVTAADAFAGWRDGLLTAQRPTLFAIGDGELSRIEIGPRLVTLFGGAPGAGKTAFVMQAVVDALRLTPTLRACVANVEMSPGVLLDRQLARLSGIDADVIRHRRFGPEHAERLDAGLATVETFAERLAFVRPPFDLGNIAATADAFHAELLVLDYVQRIRPPGEHGDRRGSVDALMDYIRQFADAGVAVVAVAAVSRSKDAKGRSSYAEGLNLASFRESSELEFGADDAFILVPGGDDFVTLRHLKSRHGECVDLTLQFDRRRQSFSSVESWPPRESRLQDALAALWNDTDPADDREGDDR